MATGPANPQVRIGEDRLKIGRQRVQQVFKYLQALHEHRNPAKRQIDEQPWHLWLDKLPDHLSIACRKAADDKGNSSANDEAGVELAPIISVERPNLSECPPPPKELRVWVKPGWEKPENECEYVAQREELSKDGAKEIVRFEADLPRRELFEEWLNKRALWQRNELLARKAMKVFEQLYELHGQLERESERYEMVLGDGIVSWRLPDGGIFHPVLIRRIQLEFDPQVPRFRVVDVDWPTELYTALFSAVPDVDGRSLEQCRSELAQGGYHPLERDSNVLSRKPVNAS